MWYCRFMIKWAFEELRECLYLRDHVDSFFHRSLWCRDTGALKRIVSFWPVRQDGNARPSHSISPVNLSSPKRPLPQLLGYPFPYVPLLSPPPAKCSRQLVQCFYFHAQILLFRPSVRKIYTKGCGVSDTVTGTVGEKLGENSNDVCNDTLNRDDVEDPHLPDPNCCRPLTKNGSLCNPTWEQIEAFRQRSARRMTTAASDRCSRWGRASRGPGSSDAT